MKLKNIAYVIGVLVFNLVAFFGWGSWRDRSLALRQLEKEVETQKLELALVKEQVALLNQVKVRVVVHPLIEYLDQPISTAIWTKEMSGHMGFFKSKDDVQFRLQIDLPGSTFISRTRADEIFHAIAGRFHKKVFKDRYGGRFTILIKSDIDTLDSGYRQMLIKMLPNYLSFNRGKLSQDLPLGYYADELGPGRAKRVGWLISGKKLAEQGANTVNLAAFLDNLEEVIILDTTRVESTDSTVSRYRFFHGTRQGDWQGKPLILIERYE